MSNNISNVKITPRNLVRTLPESSSVISKLLSSDNPNQQKKTQTILPRLNVLSNSIKDKISRNQDIETIFPDVGICVSIITSSILCPNDMITTNLVYESPEINIPDTVRSAITDVIQTHIDKEYKLTDKLVEIVEEALFRKGAWIQLIIPEASLDDILNPKYSDGQYSLENKEGRVSGYYLGKEDELLFRSEISKKYASLEGIENLGFESRDSFVEMKFNMITKKEDNVVKTSKSFILPVITDDFSIIKSHDSVINTKKNRLFKSVMHRENISVENKDKLDKFFKKNQINYNVIDEVLKISTREDASRRSIGKPLTMKLPVDVVAPVCSINDPSNHIGYFILVDENGLVLTDIMNDTDLSAYSQIAQYPNKDASSFIDRAKKGLDGMTAPDVVLDRSEDLYMEVVEDLVKKKLNAGEFKDLVELKDATNLYKIMFLRSLKDKKTNMVFVPSELIAYYAFNYRDNGTGESLFERASILFSMRAIIFITTLGAYIKNSINETEITVNLDDFDSNQEETLEMILENVIKNREQYLPLSAIRPQDLQEWFNKLGYKLNVEGSNLPKISVTKNDTSRSVKVPETDLEDKISEYIYLTFGLTPEMVKNGLEPEFATTIMSKNLMMAKMIMVLQKTLSHCLSEHGRKIIKSDQSLRDKMIDVIAKNMDKIKSSLLTEKDQLEDKVDFDNDMIYREITEYIISEWENGFNVTLPEPKTTDAQSMLNTLKTEFDNVDTVLDALFNDSFLDERYLGKTAEALKEAKEVIKMELKRKVVSENGAYPEINDLLNKQGINNDNASNVLNDSTLYLSQLVEKFLAYKQKLVDIVSKEDKPIENLNKKLEELNNGSDEFGSSSDSGGEYEDNYGDGGSGSEEMNFDEDPMSFGDEGEGGSETDGDPEEGETPEEEKTEDNENPEDPETTEENQEDEEPKDE